MNTRNDSPTFSEKFSEIAIGHWSGTKHALGHSCRRPTQIFVQPLVSIRQLIPAWTTEPRWLNSSTSSSRPWGSRSSVIGKTIRSCKWGRRILVYRQSAYVSAVRSPSASPFRVRTTSACRAEDSITSFITLKEFRVLDSTHYVGVVGNSSSSRINPCQ